MAAPAEQTTLDLSGRFLMNKSQSDDTEKILIAQGVGWWTRKVIKISSVTLNIKHYKDDNGVEHIDIDQTLSGGIPGTTENRTLDWVERNHEDHIFGAVRNKNRRLAVEEVEDAYLKAGWTEDTIQHGTVHSYAESDTAKSKRTWTAEQVWGYEVIQGDRKYVRHVKFIGGGEDIRAKLVYDWLP